MDAERESDFLEGQWDGVCRVPTESGWVTAPATLTASQQLDRTVSVEYFEGTYHGGAVKGLGLRAFNRETREWEHTWADNPEPGHFRIWKGAFVDGRSTSLPSGMTTTDNESNLVSRGPRSLRIQHTGKARALTMMGKHGIYTG
jgi:hypothetical protein